MIEQSGIFFIVSYYNSLLFLATTTIDDPNGKIGEKIKNCSMCNTNRHSAFINFGGA
jgi:hypothetical protein